MMNRRAFLAWLGGTAAGVALAPTLDVERLLWIPGEKKIFIPPPMTLQEQQRLYNYYRSCAAELLELAPKAPWITSPSWVE